MPSSSKPSPFARARSVIPATSQRPFGSACATDTIRAPGRDLREQLLLGRRVGAQQQRVGREHRGSEVGRAEQRAAHLLHRDQQLDVAHARAAVRLGHDQAGEPELLGEQRPDLGVEAALARHLRAHGRLVGVLGEKRADRRAQLVVFFGEREIECHRSLPRYDRGTSFQGMSLSTRGSPGRPSTRSPRMLRMISEVPPSIEFARERRNQYFA